ncbi:hypothetical protein OS493_008807 [Desmophyllum pertusum]|uniref:Uncharacterized protein n=1 Tax=Desmophyllum pertusum TaxID=174260 RepID=A0A9X0CYL6_9CNID|nr:hypothetical protein OS493_008807 [Desmophyllum pertusum]
MNKGVKNRGLMNWGLMNRGLYIRGFLVNRGLLYILTGGQETCDIVAKKLYLVTEISGITVCFDRCFKRTVNQETSAAFLCVH